MNIRTILKFTCNTLFLLVPLIFSLVMALEEVNIDEDGFALQGYDPVAYQTVGQAQSGSSRYEADYEGIKYRFISDDSRKLFLNKPEQYIPAYGGYCTNGVK
ncbi:MAG: YHS domain-containing (seleno)protein [Proteobacteria bacterium]|nr:YHS domain-containing (seleno)protein [Pseudomonadota bacterium]